MNIFSWFKKKDHRVFNATQEDRQLGGLAFAEKQRVIREKADLQISIAREEAALKIADLHRQQEEQKTDRLMELLFRKASFSEMTGGNEDKEADELFKVFAKNLLSKTQTRSMTPSNLSWDNSPSIEQTEAVASSTSVDNQKLRRYEDKEILDIWEKVPANFKSLANTVNDDKLFEVITEKIEDIDDESAERAISIIRGVK